MTKSPVTDSKIKIGSPVKEPPIFHNASRWANTSRWANVWDALRQIPKGHWLPVTLPDKASVACLRSAVSSRRVRIRMRTEHGTTNAWLSERE